MCVKEDELKVKLKTEWEAKFLSDGECRRHTLEPDEWSEVQFPTNGCSRSRNSSEHSSYRLSDNQPSLAALWWCRNRTVGVSRGTQIIADNLKANPHIYSHIKELKLMLDFDPQDVEESTVVIEKETVTTSNVMSYVKKSGKASYSSHSVRRNWKSSITNVSALLLILSRIVQAVLAMWSPPMKGLAR